MSCINVILWCNCLPKRVNHTFSHVIFQKVFFLYESLVSKTCYLTVNILPDNGCFVVNPICKAIKRVVLFSVGNSLLVRVHNGLHLFFATSISYTVNSSLCKKTNGKLFTPKLKSQVTIFPLQMFHNYSMIKAKIKIPQTFETFVLQFIQSGFCRFFIQLSSSCVFCVIVKFHISSVVRVHDLT